MGLVSNTCAHARALDKCIYTSTCKRVKIAIVLSKGGFVEMVEKVKSCYAKRRF